MANLLGEWLRIEAFLAWTAGAVRVNVWAVGVFVVIIGDGTGAEREHHLPGLGATLGWRS
jgi:hypothetical protein